MTARCTCVSNPDSYVDPVCPLHGQMAAALHEQFASIIEFFARLAELEVHGRGWRDRCIRLARQLGWTQDEIGEALGLTKGRVQQILAEPVR